MEIKQLLTDTKINFYFGEINKLSGEEHQQAYVKACSFSMNLLKEFFYEKLEVEVASKIDLNLKKFEPKDNTYLIETNHFFENLEIFFTDIYNSGIYEICLISDNLFINIYSDPVDIQVYYGDNMFEQRKLKLEKTFFSQLKTFFNIKTK